jgi:hypothetical protein
MSYITWEGDRFNARTAAELVRQLRRLYDHDAKTDQAFMTAMAERVQMQDRNADIPTDTVENFVKGLISARLIEKE